MYNLNDSVCALMITLYLCGHLAIVFLVVDKLMIDFIPRYFSLLNQCF